MDNKPKGAVMIDKRSKLGKMIDNSRVVYQCIKCSMRFIGDSTTNISQCPYCYWRDEIVIVGNLLVTKGV